MDSFKINFQLIELHRKLSFKASPFQFAFTHRSSTHANVPLHKNKHDMMSNCMLISLYKIK